LKIFFIWLRKFLCISNNSFSFHHEWELYFCPMCFLFLLRVRSFLCSCCTINVVYYPNWLLAVKPSLHSWDESLMLMIHNPFVLLNLFCWFCKDFCVSLYEGY
jgi:hypothetical protein